VLPKIEVPQNGWFLMQNPIKMDDLGKPTIFGNIHIGDYTTQLYIGIIIIPTYNLRETPTYGSYGHWVGKMETKAFSG